MNLIDRVGNLDMAIVIRTLVLRPAGAPGTLRVRAQAGAGVVFDSVPAREAAEVRDKLAAVVECIELAASPAFGDPDEAGAPESP